MVLLVIVQGVAAIPRDARELRWRADHRRHSPRLIFSACWPEPGTAGAGRLDPVSGLRFRQAIATGDAEP
jgi:hypothetical protein